jgi:hypothetical protein
VLRLRKIACMNSLACLGTILVIGCSHLSQAQDVSVSANSTPDESMSQSYMTLDRDCKNHVFRRDDPQAGAASCKRVAEEADRYDPKSHYITRRVAYVYYATSLIQAKQPQDAVSAGDKAVAVVLLGHDDESGSSAAYNIRGQAKGLSGDLNGSDADLEKAETYQRAALAGTEIHKDEYSKTLRGLLMFHAAVLKAMGKQDAAKLKLEEAGKL